MRYARSDDGADTLFDAEEVGGPVEGSPLPNLDAQPGAPLAARMRPRTLDEYVGQADVVGPGTLLHRAIESGQLTSAIFWGPPGSGKSTLAAIIARSMDPRRTSFESYSAVTSGVADVRKVIERARERRAKRGQRTILFVDEIHRWNKAQQDALLPHVEDGTVVLIGATTENPYFEVNAPLVSRSRIFRFESLSRDEVRAIVQHALEDSERGLGGTAVNLDDDALEHLVEISGGDARNALNALETAALSAPQEADGSRHITLTVAEQAAQQRALLYDKKSDEHYDTISAFIKSVRGSDPDAAVYWLAKMLLAGEDPKFIVRRLLILASEDIGNADPMGLVVASAAAQAVTFVGMPEAQLILSQATTYLSTAPKSNASTVAIGRAMRDIEARGPAPVPMHLRDSSYQSAAKLGHGKGYLYPHDFADSAVEQEYAPADARSGPYYEPIRYSLVARPSATVRRVVVRIGDERHEIEVGRRVGRVVAAVELHDDRPPGDNEQSTKA